MAEGRDIAAWVTASRMSGKNYFFVEGVSDENFWKKYINRDLIQIQQLNGWENVVNCVRKFNDAELSTNCIGVIDRDFEELYPYKSITEENIFFTDFHDIEMMMYMSPAWDFALKTIDKRNRIKISSKDVLVSALDITNRIGYLKLASHKNNWGLVFKKYNKNHDIELPKYERIINTSGNYEGDEKLIQYIHRFSTSNSSKPMPKIEDISDEFINISKEELPSEHLSNGHDITYVMVYILRRKYKLSENYITSDVVDIAVSSAYNVDLLKQSKLFEAIELWCKKYSKDFFYR